MKTRTLPMLVAALLLVALSSACQLVRPQVATPVDAEAIFTQAAQTIEARATREFLDALTATPTPETPTPVVVPATGTSAPPADTAVPTTAVPATATATFAPPTPTATSVPPTPTATRVPPPCNLAQYVKDISVPDGTNVLPNGPFTKIWRIRNVGSCAWNRNYAVIFTDGTDMGTNLVGMPAVVNPGETVDLAVSLQAPTKAGRYRSFWMLQSDRGRVFGIGAEGDRPFWVDIDVVSLPDKGYAYDFGAKICFAAWRSGAGTLGCQDPSQNPSGSVVLTGSPNIETGRTEDELTLVTRPQAVTNGWIQGIYPAYRVRANDHFVADLGCLNNSQGCDVTFGLDAIIGGAYRNLAQWHEVYDGKLTRADVDLTPLAGQDVQFVLTVAANSRPASANAFWLAPSIRSNFAPPPTATPSPTPTTTPPAPTPTLPPPDEGPGSDEVSPGKTLEKAIASALGVPKKDLVIVEMKPTTWQDSCLGLNSAEECAAISIPGYRFIVLAGARKFEVHTNLDGSQVLYFELSTD